MKTYQVMYSLLVGGVIEVKATSKNAAKELIFEVCTRELLDSADFEDSLEVCCIEEV